MESLLYAFAHADVYMLIMARILAFFLVLPVFSGANITAMVKIGIAASVSLVIFISGRVTSVVYQPTVLGFIMIFIAEFMVGFLSGFVVSLIFSLILLAGQLIDFQIGFSMVSVFDPVSQIQVPIVGNFFNLIITVMLVQSGGLRGLIEVFFVSYDRLPIGGAFIIGNGKLMYMLLDMLMNFMTVAVQIAMPIVGALLIIDMSMGLLVKAAPQMNVFVVGMPIKLLAGLVLLALLSPLLSDIYKIIFDLSYRALMETLQGMAEHV
jgi:flagellar biosynthetic protein FliR